MSWFESLSLEWGIALSWIGAISFGALIGLLCALLCTKEDDRKDKEDDTQNC